MKLLMLILTLTTLSPARAEGPWEASTLARLVNRELRLFGIDADVRRLLNDPQFEADLRRWWTVANPDYVGNAVRGGGDSGEALSPAESVEIRNTAVQSHLQANNDSQFQLRISFAQHMENALPSEKARIYLAYFLRTRQNYKAKMLLRIYLQEFALFAREILEDPNFPASASAYRAQIQGARGLVDLDGAQYAGCLSAGSLTATGDCLTARTLSPQARSYINCVDLFDGTAPGRITSSVRVLAECMVRHVQFKAGDSALAEAIGHDGPNHGVSHLGYLGGNEVVYLTDNRHDPEYIEFFERTFISNRSSIDRHRASRGSVDDFVRELQANATPYSGPEFPDADHHPAFQLNDVTSRVNSIFPDLLSGIRSAKYTLFVDIFFLGGTLGRAAVDELIRKANAGVKVFVLHDAANMFTYNAEIEPLFNYFVAYSKQHPENLTVVSSYIYAHRTGLPSYVDAFISDRMADSLFNHSRGLVANIPANYPKAKSDHSKIMVIDGAGMWADSVPIAYVGSKNWTDSSGAMTFDDVAKITGPAAVAIQDDYYWDMWYALRNGGIGRTPMDSAAIERILEPFDALARRWDPARKRSVPTRRSLVQVAPQEANITVRPGMISFDSAITSALDQNIQAIRRAKRQVIINDQFLYDRRIIEELIEKSEDPHLQIYILLEPISHSSNRRADPMGGFPNTLYADRLLYSQVDLDSLGRVTRRVPRTNIHLKWKIIPEHPRFHMEYHMKTISVDGFDSNGRRVSDGLPLLITGTANKDMMTMRGAFREEQVEIFDPRPCTDSRPSVRCGAVAEADRMFWRRWNNLASEREGGGAHPEGSASIDPFLFTLHPQIQSVARSALGRDMTPAEFLPFARSVIHGAYDLETVSAVE